MISFPFGARLILPNSFLLWKWNQNDQTSPGSRIPGSLAPMTTSPSRDMAMASFLSLDQALGNNAENSTRARLRTMICAGLPARKMDWTDFLHDFGMGEWCEGSDVIRYQLIPAVQAFF